MSTWFCKNYRLFLADGNTSNAEKLLFPQHCAWCWPHGLVGKITGVKIFSDNICNCGSRTSDWQSVNWTVSQRKALPLGTRGCRLTIYNFISLKMWHIVKLDFLKTCGDLHLFYLCSVLAGFSFSYLILLLLASLLLILLLILVMHNYN